MKAQDKSSPLQPLRREARRLLRAWHSSDIVEAAPALRRLLKAGILEGKTLPQLVSLRQTLQLKHALHTVSREHGCPSWDVLVQQGAPTASPNFVAAFDGKGGGFLNHWFASYDKAKAWQTANGGFLLPYREPYCVVCGADQIRSLGFDPEDARWSLIDSDGVRPADPEVWRQLCGL